MLGILDVVSVDDYICRIVDKPFDIKAHRLRLSLTQAALADRLGRAPNTIARWERGELPVPTDVRRMIEMWTTGPAARLPIPDVVTIDNFHADIVAALDEQIDPQVFEACAVDILREQWPRLVPIPGGSDQGFDGAIPGDDGATPSPLIVTTGRDPTGNLRRSLSQALRKGHRPTFAIFATSRALTPSQRAKLMAVATELGVPLQQIYDRSWFANVLYRHPEWCRRLLRLTGTPEPLSRLPVSLRASGAQEMLGRSSQLAKVRETESDVILLGGPGSGKTMLLQRLADEGYFLSEGDRDAVANSIRRRDPKLIFLDDAHDNVAQLEMLVKLRRQLGASFRIVASAWPPYRQEIREHLPNAEDVSLPELDANVVADIVRSIAPGLPNPSIKTIVRQADGRPGLAATLAQLCVDGRYRDVMTGNALYERLRGYATNEDGLLGCFALAGDVGIPLEDVATFLGRSKDDVQRVLTRLADGGVIRVSASKRFSVWPEQLRHVLVREVFFRQHSGLEHEPLMAKVSNCAAPLRVLIGATRSGAQVPRLQAKLEEVGQPELWHEYAWLEPASAGYVLDKHPEVLIDCAPAFLWHIPDRALPKLIDAVAEEGFPGSREGPALSALRHWLRRSSMDERELIKRSCEAAKQAQKWKRRGESPAAVTVFCAAMSPNCEFTESDPGRGLQVTFRYGALDDWGVARLAELWREVAPSLLRDGPLPWGPVFDLVGEWIHPNLMAPISANTSLAMRELARQMVLDLAPLAKGHPGAQRRLTEIASELEVALDAENSLPAGDLAVLFPSPDWDSEDDFDTVMKKQTENAREWGRAHIDEKDVRGVVRSVLSLQRQLNEAKTRANNQTWVAFDELARGTSNPIEWLDALVAEGADPALLSPFVRRIVDGGAEVAVPLGHLSENRYRVLVAEAAIISRSALSAAVAWAINNAAEHTEAIAGQVRVGNVGEDRVLELLGHGDARVRAAIAVAYFTRENVPSGDIESAWRSAVIDTARVPELPSQGAYWVKQILKKHPELGAEWVTALLEAKNYDLSVREIGLEVAERLSFAAKEVILRSAKFDPRQEEFFAHLVDGDPKLYEVLLDRSDLARHHLAPLGPRSRLHSAGFSGPTAPRSGWAELASMALDRDFPEDDVFEAILPHSWGFMGSEVPLWQGWRDEFEKFESHPEAAVRRIASRGMTYMDDRIADARERERIVAVRGI